MVRAVSDMADESTEDVERWRAYACEVAAAYAVALLRSGPVTLSRPSVDLTTPPAGWVCRRGLLFGYGLT